MLTLVLWQHVVFCVWVVRRWNEPGYARASCVVQRETDSPSHAVQHTIYNHNQAHSKQRTTHTQNTTRCHSTKVNITSNSLNVLNYEFSKERYMLPEDDRVIETYRSVLNILM